MSRRVPNPAADRAAKNQQTIKGLLKLEGNKSCADCKRNKRIDTRQLNPQIGSTHDRDADPYACLYRSKMGELESGHLRLHSVCRSNPLEWWDASLANVSLQMLWHPSWHGNAHQSRQVGGSGCLDGRAAGECDGVGEFEGEQVCMTMTRLVKTSGLLTGSLGIGKRSWHRAMSLQMREYREKCWIRSSSGLCRGKEEVHMLITVQQD